MSKITDTVWTLAEPIAREHGCEIWDVEYVKEAGGRFLRVYLDREGGISIEHCEAVSRALDPILDEKDPIPDSYTFEVSSAGAERALKRPSDFERFMGSLCEVKLYRAVDKKKEYVGHLKGYVGGAVTLEIGGREITFPPEDVANVRLRIEF